MGPSLGVVVAALLAFVTQTHGEDYPYLVGAGRSDITGPAAEVEMMGYAVPKQTAKGIHFRQWSRAFVISDANKASRVVFVNIDACMGTQILKMKVVEKLNKTYGSLYTNDNVCISGTHTHSAPAGFFQYFLYEITSLGFVRESLDALVDGVVSSIQEAHENMRPSKLFYNQGMCLNASINRSPTAYPLNPDHDIYKYDTDKDMSVLKFVDSSGKAFGMIDWFPVHCTSMNMSNQLISGDNKGYASMLMEEAMDPGSLPGKGKYVAAFAQGNEGDVTPNINGPKCIDSNEPCDLLTSTCHGKEELCIAFGPGKDMFESTQIIGERQFNTGKSLFDSAKTEITGPVDFVHVFRNMSDISLTFNKKTVHTCRPAMGFSFAAGTIDGHGDFNFTQGDTNGSPLWKLIRNILHKPSEEQVECQKPKPILLDTGNMDFPYPWQPEIVPLQILRVGQLVLIAVPGEFTTMSGRYLRGNVSKVLMENGFGNDVFPVIAGLSNTYTSYITTYYEYQQQRYEAASTIFGPHTLDAYIQEYNLMAAHLANKKNPLDPGPKEPPDYSEDQWELLPGVEYDMVPPTKSFGQVYEDVRNVTYSIGDTVNVSFWSGNPRNDRKNGSTFLTVEKKGSNNEWVVMRTDACWDTRFHWDRPNFLENILHMNIVTVEWIIPSSTKSGTYRIQHFGNYKSVTGGIKAFNGTSSTFVVKGD